MIQDAGALYYLAICHERGLGTARNEAKAAELYHNAASRGHADALYNLAVFFENGIGGTTVDVSLYWEFPGSSGNPMGLGIAKLISWEWEWLEGNGKD